MLLIVEIVLLVFGLLAIVRGKLPSFLVGGGQYRIEGPGARLLGLLFILPLPIGFIGGLLLTSFLGEQGIGSAFLLEFFTILSVMTIGVIAVRFIRQPTTTADTDANAVEGMLTIEENIARKARSSLLMAALGILGFSAIVFGPWAFVRAGQVLRLIDEHNTGEHYRRMAVWARILAVIFFILGVVLPVTIFTLFLTGIVS